MKKVLISSIIVAVGFLMMISSAMAYPVNTGDYIYVAQGPGGANGGGAFTVANPYDTTDILFTTFCLERDEFLNPFPGNFYIDSITDEAINGGLGGPSPDPLSSESAYLVNQWATWAIAHTAINANALQLAIWKFEEEWNPALDGLALTFYDDAAANNNGTLYGVQVMNLLLLNNTGAAGVLAQDLAVYTPVPEPTILILLGLGLMGLVGARKFKK